ncbi:TonB-dependent receptor, partial [Brachyspira hampsonii]|nr:TonB-dependent receptor [Brachyspira hampsonii]
MPVFLLILLYMFLSFHIYAEDENTFDYKIIEEETNEIQASHKEKGFLLDRSINISKNQIKSSKAKNTAELIKEYCGIDIKNKTVYSQSTFILNGRVLNNEEKKVYLFLYNKDDIDSIYIDYYGSIGSIVYN